MDGVKCNDCKFLRGAWCVNAQRAGLHNRNERAEISKALAEMPQRCPGFDRKKTSEEG